MPLLVDLPPDVELKVREVAQAEGVDVSALVRETMEARLRQYDPSRSLSEAQLLARINKGFSEVFWTRYRELIAKRRAEALTDKEQQEAIAMSDRLEAWHVERLQYLIRLAGIRQKSVDALTQELGLRPMPVE